MLLFAIEAGDLTYSADSVNISTITDKLLLFTRHYSARCFGMNMSKSRDIQAKMPSPKVIYASNESKSVLARNLEECRDNDKNSQSVFLSFKCILARNCEGTEQLQKVLF